MPRATPFPLSRPKAAAILREAAQATDRVEFTVHARQQMRRRRITVAQVLHCLMRGRIAEGPAPDVRGNWTCRVEGVVAGRGLGVAAAIEITADVVVITAFWMD